MLLGGRGFEPAWVRRWCAGMVYAAGLTSGEVGEDRVDDVAA